MSRTVKDALKIAQRKVRPIRFHETIARRGYAEGGVPDEESQEKFLKEQLEGSAPQYEPEAGLKTAKEAGLMAAGFAPGAGIAAAAGKFPTAEGGFEPSAKEDWEAGRYGSAAMKAAGAAGDVASAIPVVGTAAGAALKAPLAAKLAMAVAPAAKLARETTTAGNPVQDALRVAYQRQINPAGMYSHAAETAANLPQAKGSYEQMMAMLQKSGVKPEELHWSGVEKFAGQPVTREQLVEHFEQNVPEIKETVFGSIPSEKMASLRDEYAQIEHGDIYRNLPSEDKRRIDDLIMERRSTSKYHQYQLPGSENYREVLLTLPSEVKKLEARRREIEALGRNATKEQRSEWADIMNRLRPDDRDIEGIARYRGPAAKAEYQSSHWDEPNVLAHLRMSDRTGPEGEKVLHLEEIQSDWGQEGRKRGFNTRKGLNEAEQKEFDDIVSIPMRERTNEQMNRFNELVNQKSEINFPSIPSAPYVASPEGKHTSSWVDLGLKRALKEAAEGGYDKLVWTPGAEQAARYDLSKKIKSLSYDPEEKTLSYVPHGGRGGWEDFPGNIEPDQLESHIGKDVAAKLLAQDPHPLSGNHILEDLNLQAGGEGMKSFYDKIVPTQLSKIVKKLDPSAKIELGVHPIATEGSEVRAHVIPITSKMREAILKGLPAYAQGGTVAPNDKSGYTREVRPVVKQALKISRALS